MPLYTTSFSCYCRSFPSTEWPRKLNLKATRPIADINKLLISKNENSENGNDYDTIHLDASWKSFLTLWLFRCWQKWDYSILHITRLQHHFIKNPVISSPYQRTIPWDSNPPCDCLHLRCYKFIVRGRGHTTLFFDIYNVFNVSYPLMCADFKSDVCQLVGLGVVQFFYVMKSKMADRNYDFSLKVSCGDRSPTLSHPWHLPFPWSFPLSIILSQVFLFSRLPFHLASNPAALRRAVVSRCKLVGHSVCIECRSFVGHYCLRRPEARAEVYRGSRGPPTFTLGALPMPPQP